MAYSKSIENMKNTVNEFLNRYSEINDKTITPQVISDIKKDIDSLHNNLRKYNNELKKSYEIYDKEFEAILKDYDQKYHFLIEEQKDKKIDISKLYATKIKNLNDEVTKAENRNTKDINTAENDIEITYSVSNQNVEMFEDEFQDTKARLAYQYSAAKDSYNKSIDANNDVLYANLEKLKNEYDNKLKLFDLDTSNVISIYTKKINDETEKIKAKELEYQEKIKIVKEKKRDESADLNNTIRGYFQIRGNEIEKARDKSEKSNEKMSEERDLKRQDYNQESQKITKEFVSKINVLDEDENKLKDNFDSEMLEQNQNMNYESLKIHKRQEGELSAIYNSNAKPFQAKLRVHRTNRFYYKLKQQSKKSFMEIINKVEKQYTSDIEKNNYQKRLLDINRSYSFKKLTELEIRDNKRYQEIENLHEATLNHEIYIANQKCNKKSNDAKLKSNIKNIYFESEIDKIDAVYQKDIESLNVNIKKKSLEIDISKRLNEIIHNYEKEKYERTVSYHTVSNLLTIERYKLLNQYNKQQFDINLEGALASLNHSKNKMDIHNRQNNDITKQKILISKKKLENFKEYSKYSVIVQNINKEKELSVTSRNYFHNNDLIIHKTLSQKFEYEIKKIENSISSFIIMTRNIENTTITVIHELLKLLKDDSDLSLFKNFSFEIINELFAFYRDMMSDLKDNVIKLINERISFEENFKFKRTFIELRNQYTMDMSYQKSRQVLAQKHADGIEKEIDDYNRTINNYEYSIELKIRSGISRKELTLLQAETSEKIKKLKKNIEMLNAELATVKANIAEINDNIVRIETSYNDALSAAKVSQRQSADSYYVFKADITKYFEKITIQFKNDINEKFENDNKNINFSLKQLEGMIISRTDKGIEEIYTLFNNFKNNAKKNNTYLLNILISTYEKDINKINNNTMNMLMKEREKYDDINERIAGELKNLDNEMKNIIHHYEDLIEENENAHLAHTNDILNRKNEYLEKFYRDLYAINSNKEDIEKDYNAFLSKSYDDLQNAKKEQIEKSIQEQNKLENDLLVFIESRDEIVKHLPIAVKEQIRDLQEENKNKNHVIDDELLNERNEYQTKTRELKRVIASIDAIYQANILKHEIECKKLEGKERKNLVQTLVKINPK